MLMRKLMSEFQSKGSRVANESWLDLSAIATAELSSEDPEYPLENALESGRVGGFRAATPGIQNIRLVFDRPQSLRKIRLEFQEVTASRSQEFALFSTSSDAERRELVRQQWTFSPGGSTEEVEEYVVNLQNVISIDLLVDPGRHDKNVFVSLRALRLAS